MAKVLLVDTNFSSRPIFNELSRLGHEVHVVGSKASDSLAKGYDHYWQLDYADTTALSRLVETERFEYLVPGCTDRSYSSCAIVSEDRFPGIDSVDVDHALNFKDQFRNLANRLKLPVPKVQWQDEINATSYPTLPNPNLNWPLVVKPVDGFSGKGITILHHADEVTLRLAVSTARLASPSGQCLIESYVHGQLHSHSAFLHSGRVVHDVIVEEHCTANHVVVDTSRMLTVFSDNLQDKLRFYIETLANALQLKDGLVHTQFILNGEEIWLIEVTRRCPGDLYSQLIELSGRKGYVNNYVRPFLGLSIETSPPQPYIPIMRHTVTVSSKQAFHHLHFCEPLHLERWVPLSLTGDILQPSPATRIGILFARAESQSHLDNLYSVTLARQLYQVVA